MKTSAEIKSSYVSRWKMPRGDAAGRSPPNHIGDSAPLKHQLQRPVSHRDRGRQEFLRPRSPQVRTAFEAWGVPYAAAWDASKAAALRAAGAHELAVHAAMVEDVPDCAAVTHLHRLI